MEPNLARLAEPFEASDIEWRVGMSGVKNGKPWIKALAYITGRAVMNRLDEVFGVGGWSHEVRPIVLGDAHGIICRLSAGGCIHEDVAEVSDIEALKGAASGALKRAAVSLGIGRYLYDLEDGFATITEHGIYSSEVKDKQTKASQWVHWNPPQLPAWALPKQAAVPMSKRLPGRDAQEQEAPAKPAKSSATEERSAKVMAAYKVEVDASAEHVNRFPDEAPAMREQIKRIKECAASDASDEKLLDLINAIAKVRKLRFMEREKLDLDGAGVDDGFSDPEYGGDGQ